MRWLGVLIACGTVSCGVSGLRARAAHDFGCSDGEVEIRTIGAGAYAASGCGQSATYVCKSDGFGTTRQCFREGGVSGGGGGYYATPSAPPEKKATGDIVVEHDGARFTLPNNFARDDDASDEVYRDDNRHRAVRLRILAEDAVAADWVAKQMPDAAQIWTKNYGGRDVVLATKIGKSLRVTTATVSHEAKLYELACTHDDLKLTKTDSICTTILLSFRVGGVDGPPASAGSTI